MKNLYLLCALGLLNIQISTAQETRTLFGDGSPATVESASAITDDDDPIEEGYPELLEKNFQVISF